MVASKKTPVDRRTEALIIGHLSDEGTVEHSLDRTGLIEHPLDGIYNLLHGTVLILKEILFQLGVEIRLGVVHHESQHVGVCQRVPVVKCQEEVLSNLVIGI